MGYTHQEVVNLLKAQQFNVVLDVQRTINDNSLQSKEGNQKSEETITVVLDKSECKIIGILFFFKYPFFFRLKFS